MPVVQPAPEPADAVPAVGIRATYDAVARMYDAQLGNELDGKPLDRALLTGFLELVGPGTVADVGCGPGHVARFLAARHPDVIGLDLSPGMVGIAREHAPELPFVVGSMLALPVAAGGWSGAVAMYSIIHLTAAERRTAFCELARAIRAGGRLLVSFHVDSHDFAAGQVNHLTEWFGERVEIDGYFPDPAEVTAELEAAAFTITARVDRQPAGPEYPSRRCYLLAQRR